MYQTHNSRRSVTRLGGAVVGVLLDCRLVRKSDGGRKSMAPSCAMGASCAGFYHVSGAQGSRVRLHSAESCGATRTIVVIPAGTMALTRDFKETILAGVQRDPKFRNALLGIEA